MHLLDCMSNGALPNPFKIWEVIRQTAIWEGVTVRFVDKFDALSRLQWRQQFRFNVMIPTKEPIPGLPPAYQPV